jgi:phage terminase large subunit
VVDNNVTPYISVQAWQIEMGSKRVLQVYEMPCASPNNTASKAARVTAKWLTDQRYTDTVHIYGDPSSNARSTVDDEGKSFFDKFIGEITASGFKVNNKVQKSAPGVSISGDFINEIYESNYEGWKIEIDTNCRKSIEDYAMAKEAPDGTILKKRVTDKETGSSYEKYGHMSDCKRYFITTVLNSEFISYSNKSVLKRPRTSF